jgi:hypothetical protein
MPVLQYVLVYLVLTSFFTPIMLVVLFSLYHFVKAMVTVYPDTRSYR